MDDSLAEHKHLIETEIASQEIYKGRIVRLLLNTVRLPDGHETIREVVRHPGAIAMVPLLPDGQVVLVRQFRAAIQKVTLEIPAGTLDPGEEPLVAAARELQEETGYFPGKLTSLGGIFVAPSYSDEIIHIYRAEDLQDSRLHHDKDEFIDRIIMPLPVALEKVMSGEIQDAKSVTGLLRVAFALKS